MNFRSPLILAAILVLFVNSFVLAQNVPQPRSREEFAKAMAKISENMSESDVVSLLGKPDDIRTQNDPGGIKLAGTKEIWCYGSKGHLSFPTLGCVYIDTRGRSQQVFGGRGSPPKPGLFSETELQNLLCLLDSSPGLNGYSYNPLPVIQIVNTLQPLGKEKALAAIGEYIRVSDQWTGYRGAQYGLSLVLRTLFDLPKDIDPRMGTFGAPYPPGPKNPHQIPRFPIALVDDIPMMLVGGYQLGGVPSSMNDVLDFYRVHGCIRAEPLVPSNDPLSALTNLMKSTQWIYADPTLAETYGISSGDAETEEREKTMLMEQLLRLIDSVYRLPTDVYDNRLPCGEPPEPIWQETVSNVSALKIKWDSQQNVFAFQDGTHLPTLKKKIYQRNIWKLTGLGFDNAELVLERKNDDWLDVIIYWSEGTGVQLKPGDLLVYAGADKRSPSLEFKFTDKVGSGVGATEMRTVALKTDSEVWATLIIDGGQTNASPVFIP